MFSFVLRYWMIFLPTAVSGLYFLRMIKLLYEKKQSEKQPAPIVVIKRIK